MSEQTASQQRRADLGKSQDQVAAMFDDVSSRYDVMNALLSGGMNFVWLKALTNALAPKPSDRILDLAALQKLRVAVRALLPAIFPPA